MTRLIPPNFFFDETSADEDLMAEKDAEKAKAGLDPDGLFEAQMAYGNVYDGPGSEEAAMATAIHAYLDAADEEAQSRLEAFMAGLANFQIELEKLRQAIEGEAPWRGAA